MRCTGVFERWAVIVFLLLGATVSAQEGSPTQNDHKRREDAREMMESIRIWKITQELEVDESLASRLFPRINESNRIRRQTDRDIAKSLAELQVLIEKGAPDSALNAGLENVIQVRENGMRAIRQSEDRIMELLTPKQKAKYLVLESEFPRKVRDFMRQHRSQKRGEAGNGSGPPPWTDPLPPDGPPDFPEHPHGE